MSLFLVRSVVTSSSSLIPVALPSTSFTLSASFIPPSTPSSPFLILLFLTFLLSPSSTLILRGRSGCALWDWSKEGLILYLSLCVDVFLYVSSFAPACVHTILLVWNKEILVWIYKRIQWCGVEFSFLSLQKEDTAARWGQGETCTFLLLLPQSQKQREWSMEHSSVISFVHRSSLLLVFSTFQGFCALVSESMRAEQRREEEGRLQALRWCYSFC